MMLWKLENGINAYSLLLSSFAYINGLEEIIFIFIIKASEAVAIVEITAIELHEQFFVEQIDEHRVHLTAELLDLLLVLLNDALVQVV